MAVDLKAGGVIRVQSLIVNDDHLVILERDGYKDRIRKTLFDRVDSIVTWKTLPWGRMLFFLFLLGGPAVPMAIADADLLPFAVVLFVILAIIEARYLLYMKTWLCITRAGTSRIFSMVVRPGRFRTVLDRMRANIVATQRKEAERARQRIMEQSNAEIPGTVPGGASDPAPVESSLPSETTAAPETSSEADPYAGDTTQEDAYQAPEGDSTT